MDPKFDFDVAATDAPWMNANEDGVLSVKPKRNRTTVHPVREITDVIAAQIGAGLTLLGEMGILQVYGEELCRFMLDRHRGNVEQAVESLTALGGPAELH